jgi:hypothetical protein
MDVKFRYASLALLLAACAALPIVATLAGHGDWQGYDWNRHPVSACETTPSGLDCPTFTQKWDWKRDQWVDVTLRSKPEGLTLTQRLTNNDRRDEDFVCVTVQGITPDEQTLFAHHQNWHMDAGQTREQSFTLPAIDVTNLAYIELGTKQCRGGAHEDDAIYAKILHTIAY